MQTNATAQRMGLLQIVEGQNSWPLRGKTVTLQAKVANPSGSANARFAILEWTGVSDTVTSDVVRDWNNASYTANNFFLSSGITVAAVGYITGSGWQNIALSANISNACNNLMVFFWTESPATQNGVLALMEADCHLGGSRFWDPRPAGEELALCQRYYEKSYYVDVKPGTADDRGGAIGSLNRNKSYDNDGWYLNNFMTFFAVTKRGSVALTLYSPKTGAVPYAGEYNTVQAFIADRRIQQIEGGPRGYGIASADGTFGLNNLEWHHFVADSEI
jgi:hypothetical protein